MEVIMRETRVEIFCECREYATKTLYSMVDGIGSRSHNLGGDLGMHFLTVN